jgi:hypothetical protein
LTIPTASRVFPSLFCITSDCFCLILRFLIHFELILVKSDKHGSRFSFLQVENYFSKKHLLKKLFIVHHSFLQTVENNVGIDVWIHILVLHSVPLVCTSVFVPVPAVFIAIAL